MNGATASGEVQNLVFSRWIEVKHKAEPHNYIEFFLVTDTGNEVLAISAEDHGNSHYVYQSTGAFAKYGPLNSKNRADTISWLESIIKESQIKVDSQLAEEMAHAGEPTPDNPLGLYYTHHKAEKTANPDGTHTQRFFLLDQYGTWHLAVIGEERETRDGHYLYKATEEFAARYPLSCHAQKDVIHWLEQRVTHGSHSQPPPPLPSQQRRTDASGGGSAAVSGTGAGSMGSADAWGPTGPGGPAGLAYPSAATPTSAVDGMVGSDGAGLLLTQAGTGDLSFRQLTPPPTAIVPSGNQLQQPQTTPPLPELLPQQPQLLPPQLQVPGLANFQTAAATSNCGAPGSRQQQQQPGAAQVPTFCGAQLTVGAAQGTCEALPPALPMTALQVLAHAQPVGSAASASPFFPNHVGLLPAQAGEHQVPGFNPAVALSHPQQQPLQNGPQHPYQHQHTQQHQQLQQQQPVPRMFADNAAHGAAVATPSAPAAGPASEKPPLATQQQQYDAAAALQPRGLLAGLTTGSHSHSQQEARSQSASATPPPPQQQLFHIPMLLDPSLQMQQQSLPQGQQGSQTGLPAEQQGLAQLLGLAGLAASMQQTGGNAAQQLPNNGSTLPLQLPMPPQLQLQGSSGSQLTTTPLQQQPQQPFMLPNLFQQPQQPLLPLQQFNAQTQQEQQQQMQLLQQQIQQQSQQLQQLLQCGVSGGLPPASIGGQQQSQQQQSPSFLGGGLQQLPHPGSALQALSGFPAGGQPWSSCGGPTPPGGGAPQQHIETPALLASSGQGQTGLPPPLQLPGLLSRDLSTGTAGAGVNALGTPSAALVGSTLGPPPGQVHVPGPQPLGAGGAAASGGSPPAHTFGGSAGGGVAGAGPTGRPGPDQVGGSGTGGSVIGFGMSAWPAGLTAAASSGSFPQVGHVLPPHPHPYPHPQQPQQQSFGQPGGAANPGTGAFGGLAAADSLVGGSGPAPGLLNGGGAAQLAFGGRGGAGPPATGPTAPTGAGALPASLAFSLPGGLGAAGGLGGLAGSGGGETTPAGVPLQQPLPMAGGHGVPSGVPLPAVRTKEAGPGHLGGRGGAGGRGSSGKHKLAGVAEVAHKRKLARLAAAGEEAVRLAQGAYLASLRHQALSEAAQQEALRKTIASWVRGQISDDEVSVSGWHESLQQMLRDANRSRTVSVPFLSNDRLLELTRGSAEAITLGAALSLAAPHDPNAVTGQPRTPAPPLPLPTPAATGAAAAGQPVAVISGCSTQAAGSGGGAGAAGVGALPGSGPESALPSSAEQMAALSSLKALLDGNLLSAALGPTATPTGGPAADGNAASTGPVRMDVDGAPAGASGSGQADVHMADAACAAPTPPAGAGPQAAVTATPSAAVPGAADPQSSQPQPSQPPSLPPTRPSAAAAAAPPTQPPRPTGPAATAGLVACAGSAKSWSFSDSHVNRHGVRIALESLREVAALCPPVANMASSSLVETVKQFESHPHPSVSGLAKEILKRWRGALIHRLRAMSDSRCYQDPVAALESKIQANEIVFPSINELLGGPRAGGGSAAAAAVTPADAATLAAPLPPPTAPAAVPYTPSAAIPVGVGGGFGVVGNAAYSLAVTPTPASEGLGGLPATPPLTLNTAITPALTTAGTTATFGATVTPAGGLSVAVGAAPGSGVAATSTAETPLGLFDAAAAPGTSGAGSLPTPQLFSRPGGAAAPLAPAGPGAQPLELSAPQLQPPAAPLFPPMSPPPAAALAPVAAPSTVTPSAPPPPSPPPAAAILVPPATATGALPPPSPAIAAPSPQPPVPAVLPPSPAAAAAAAILPPSPMAVTQEVTTAAVTQPQLLTPLKAPPLSPAPAPQLPSPAPPPPPASPACTASTATEGAAAPSPAAEPMETSPAALPPVPSPLKSPAMARATAATALPPPSPAKPPAAAASPAPDTTVAGASGTAVAPAVMLPPPPPSGAAPGSVGPPGDVPAFGLAAPPLLPGLASPPQATTAEVAALLAASAQSLAAHMQTAAAAGGGGAGGAGLAPPPLSFSPAQLRQLGTLATTTTAYASAFKSSDPAVAAGAWQSLVQQLRQAHALNLGLGLVGSPLGDLPRFVPSPPPSALASAAAGTPGQQPLLAGAAWPTGNWAASWQPQLLQRQPMQSPASAPPPSTGHPPLPGPAPPAPAAGIGAAAAAREPLPPTASGTGAADAAQTGAEATPAITPEAGTQAGTTTAAAASGTQPETAKVELGESAVNPPPVEPPADAAPKPPPRTEVLPSVAASNADAASAPHAIPQADGSEAAVSDGSAAGGAAAGDPSAEPGGALEQQQLPGVATCGGSGLPDQDVGGELDPATAGGGLSVQGLQVAAEQRDEHDVADAGGGALAGGECVDPGRRDGDQAPSAAGTPIGDGGSAVEGSG